MSIGLKDKGYLFLIWNNQTFHNTSFLTELERDIINVYQNDISETEFEYNYKLQKIDILQLFLNEENRMKFKVTNNDYITFGQALKQRGDISVVINNVLSKSLFSNRTEQERAKVKSMIHGLVRKHYGSIEKARVTMYYDTDLIIAQKM